MFTNTILRTQKSALIHRVHFARLFSHNRPPIYDILPTKRLMNRVLFDLDAPHSFGKLYPVYESVYKALDTESEATFPKYITASDLMIMKRALENIRLQSHTANRHLVALENALLEYAAEAGNNDAVAMLAFEAIVSDTADQDDKTHAKKLVEALLKLKHPLTVKLSGDLCMKGERLEQAEKFYLDFLQLENDTFLASEVYKQLGVLNFQKPDLVAAKQYFERSISTGPIDKVADCHYYLGQLNAHIPETGRHHFELAASQGFRESFQQLGFLELNYFNAPKKAREWFRLGSELGDVSCIIGLFDCSVTLGDFKHAYAAYNTLKTSLEDSETEENKLVWKHFLESREKSLALMHDNFAPLNETLTKIKDFQETETETSKDNARWGL
ncbi:CYFA0S08e03026g1_1 [Cyberlindnera fabianii]|uniref:CYFA0S08e03026g1_1 n=1 Tax=Cyberlindnera fabianii TaxID=36022 RepID=A0A061AXX1_CYBFA|nr:CYFA0S08e03026g1_1 [Cyberlindnera fabianii]